ncbi:hypothetical protein [Nocardia sp. NPDC050793]
MKSRVKQPNPAPGVFFPVLAVAALLLGVAGWFWLLVWMTAAAV